MTEPVPPVVSAEWVDTQRDNIRIVDVREAWEYADIGHIPGAVNIPFDDFRGGSGDVGMLPGRGRFSELLSTAGVTRDDRLVAYDDEHGVFAARFLVTALLYGHEHWHLLDGDYSAWNREHVTTTEVPAVTPSEYDAVVPASRPLIDADGVLEGIEDSNTTILDTRSPAEFRSGHLRGAENLDWRELIDPDTRKLQSKSTLAAILAEHGVQPGRRVILYCNTARRISHTYVVLKHLEYDEVAFYEGSLTDWRERGLPLVEESA